MGFFQEFKEFAVKGNVMDMAVGIILGVAFNKIVTSLVQDIIMPPIGVMLGEVEFKDLKFVMVDAQPAVTDAANVVVTPAVNEAAIRYGMFINTVIEFFIVALSVFVVVKVMNRLVRKREVQKA